MIYPPLLWYTIFMKKFGPYLVILIILVAGIYVWSQNNEQATVTQEVEQVTVEGVGIPEGKVPVSGVDTLAALAAQGDDLECQIIQERSVVEGNIEGTYFTHNGKLRGDFMVPAPEFGGKIVSSMIVDTDMLFVWATINGETSGFKSDLTIRDASISTKEPIALNQPVKYTCTDWDTVDGSVFIPPAAVTFTDTAAAVNRGMEQGILPQ